MSVRKMGVCAVEECGPKLIQARGLCATHYSRLRNHGDPVWEPPLPDRPCSVEGCDSRHYCKSYCVKHYQRWRAHGDVHANPRVYAGPECAASD